ncbi:hypothetical protein Knedl_CDS0001 [Pseudomonas phage Knedl]|nr:hypothetical protein Knedl_CDS0001 [Pseudomonas phage Knedl]
MAPCRPPLTVELVDGESLTINYLAYKVAYEGCLLRYTQLIKAIESAQNLTQ